MYLEVLKIFTQRAYEAMRGAREWLEMAQVSDEVRL